MPSKVIAISGPVTRTYTISQNAKLHTVSLFHNTITGQRALSIDGVEVGGTAGTTSLLSPRKALVFQIGEGCGEVSISHEGTHVVYTCFWSVAGPEGASVEVSEENDVVNGTTEADLDGTKDTNRLRISIEAADTGVDETGKPVSWYRIKTLRENDQREVTVHRRFRDFFSVEEQLKSSYKGSHLLASFPSLPPRTLAGSMLSSLFGSTSHLDAGFVEERRWKLSDWLYKTSQLPRMRTNVDFLTFLGICDDFRETSVLFPKDVPMGLTLNKAQGDSVEVGGLKALQDGSPSPAQMSNLIFVGDQISKVNGDSVLGEGYDVVIAKVKAAPKPLMLHFLGRLPPRDEDALAGAAGGAGAGVADHRAAAVAKMSHAPSSSAAPTTTTDASSLGVL